MLAKHIAMSTVFGIVCPMSFDQAIARLELGHAVQYQAFAPFDVLVPRDMLLNLKRLQSISFSTLALHSRTPRTPAIFA